ncbi:phosphatase 2C-like domain-containing protein [Dactylonectria macrodidyma]|uniref:Phosphatase 2C-like domain-containing protein n=1 Tax=Dactylonectria macrodidyma TaxID=307937 RepID=A0A9P9EPB7_9HYPO|nr:phosphatase 2C-like domain-containing protein [Dactylonectria macrodidyma]
MFGSNSNSAGNKSETDSKSDKSPSPEASPGLSAATPIKTADKTANGEKRGGNGSPPTRQDTSASTDKKRRSSSVSSKASSLLASAKNSLSFSQGSRAPAVEMTSQSPLQKLGKQDPALAVPQGQHNNSAGESVAGPKSTFHVGVWEDRNKKCRRTMEDTHAFLYNFIQTPTLADASGKDTSEGDDSESAVQDAAESDNGYFAIFDGHAGTFAADWCGKKLHIILEELIRKNPNAQIPEVLDLAFTTADSQLEKLPLKNSGCTAAVAVLRWEDRISNDRSTLDSATAANLKPIKSDDSSHSEKEKSNDTASATNELKNLPVETSSTKTKGSMNRQRVLYTANVGDARIILCRAGKALRLSYDHKGSDEVEGKRIANAGGLILNNRVNGVLAVTRALGDAYMKKLVTGHPYTTETVIQPDSDEFIIIACDGLWDVCTDQEAVDLVRNVEDPIVASKKLVDHALNRFSTDNLSCMIVRLDHALRKDDRDSVSEADKAVNDTAKTITDGSVPAGETAATDTKSEGEFVPTTLDKAVVEEEPDPIDEKASTENDKDAQKPVEDAPKELSEKA